MENRLLQPTITTRIKDNWFTRPLHAASESVTTLFVLALVAIAMGVWNDVTIVGYPLRDLLVASKSGVFERAEVWQLWTTLFVHADAGHLLSNLLLFVPLSYFLTGYFGLRFFPLFGIAVGGLTNYLTLKSMPESSSLVGISGVVFWMGAAWLTLYALLETKESARRRIGKSLVIAAALFLPQGYEPNISYMAHTIGFGFGVVSAIGYFVWNRKRFLAAEKFETLIEEPADWEIELAQEQYEACLLESSGVGTPTPAALTLPASTTALTSSLGNRYSPDLRPCRTC